MLQNGIKMTVEPPTGLKSNLAQALLTVEPKEGNARPHEFKTMFFTLSFYSLILNFKRRRSACDRESTRAAGTTSG